MELNESKQLGLDLKLTLHYNLKDFYAGENNFLITQLQNSLNKTQEFSYFYIWGDKDSGKTHILKGIQNQAAEKTLYINLEKLSTSTEIAEFFNATETRTTEIFCLDDLDKIDYKLLAKNQWELKLFNLFNLCKERNKKLIISSSISPSELAIDLPDLRSRLSWGLVHKLISLTDAEKSKVLIFYAQSNFGLKLKEEVINYILLRSERNMASLFNTLSLLAKASIEAQKEVSKPFIKQVMNW